MFYNIAVCDDEQPQIELLTMMVKSWSKQAHITAFKSAESFSFALGEGKSFDILLLDIQMTGQNGIELAKEIRKSDESLAIIFITGLSEYINEGYEVSAIHYLIKPINQEKLNECLDKACKLLSKPERTLLFTVDGEAARVNADDIIYAESFAHSTDIYVFKDKNSEPYIYKIRKNISELDALLGEGFFRCHRSYIVGIKYITRITKTDIILDIDGKNKAIPLSRRNYNDANKTFIKYFKEAD